MRSRRFVVLKFGSDLHKLSVDLREEILRKPLGMRFSEKELELEKDEFHLAMVTDLQSGDVQIDAVLLLKRISIQGSIKMRQVATRTELQGMGIGSELVEKAEIFAMNRGFRIMQCNARESAVPFYLNLGYRVVSKRFIEVNIPHFTMEKNLIS